MLHLSSKRTSWNVPWLGIQNYYLPYNLVSIFYPISFSAFQKDLAHADFRPFSATAMSPATYSQSTDFLFSITCSFRVHWHCTARKKCSHCGMCGGFEWKICEAFNFVSPKKTNSLTQISRMFHCQYGYPYLKSPQLAHSRESTVNVFWQR